MSFFVSAFSYGIEVNLFFRQVGSVSLVFYVLFHAQLVPVHPF